MSPRKRVKREFPPLSGRIDRHAFDIPLTIGILSDTHIFAGGGSRTLPTEVIELFRRFDVDLIIHGGDIVIQGLLDRLATVAPVLAVYGNNEPVELWRELPERIVLTAGSHAIGIVHGHGGASARAVARTAFDEPVEFVIYGHSHIPMIEEENGIVYFNPGSPTDRRWSAHFGIGIVRIDEERVRPELILFDRAAHLVSIDPESPPGADA
ncbi:MAG: metallophosphatase family protein [Thermomicrobiales bacterium]|nr:metallophosphatase family protein [Thermomicrobiales bacterium]